MVGGVLAGIFRPSVLPLIAEDWLAVSLAVGGTLLLSLGAASLLARFARLDRRSAVLGTLPGAASGMLTMSDPLGADPRLVALMQYARVVLVVVSAAFIARFGGTPGGAVGSGAALGAEEVLVHGAWTAYVLTAVVAVVGVWAGTPVAADGRGTIGAAHPWRRPRGVGELRPAWPPGVPPLAYTPS